MSRIPANEKARFEKLQMEPLALTKEIRLMPCMSTRARFGVGGSAVKKLLKQIKVLESGTRIIFDKVRMDPVAKGHPGRAWYKIHVENSRVSGWINSVALQDIIFQ